MYLRLKPSHRCVGAARRHVVYTARREGGGVQGTAKAQNLYLWPLDGL